VTEPRGFALPLVHPDVLVWLRDGIKEGWWDDLTGNEVINQLHDEFSKAIDDAIKANNDPSTSMDLRPTPDAGDRAQVLAQSYMVAVMNAFREVDELAEGEDAPNVTIVLGYAPDGRVAIASTEPEPYILMALYAGIGSIQRAFRLRGERN
jgi:hypothetical protein